MVTGPEAAAKPAADGDRLDLVEKMLTQSLGRAVKVHLMLDLPSI